MKRFAIFILSHGRAKTITTYEAMRNHGYTGEMFVVIDDEDDQEDLYREKFGKDIIQFCKRDYVSKTDLGDLDDNRKIGVLARNFIQDKAKEMGYQYHLQLDDDISGLQYRFEKDGRLQSKVMDHLDEVLEAMCVYMDEGKFTSLSFGLSNYYLGGNDTANWRNGMIPKTMTTFLMRGDDVQYFHMRMNDDITTSALNGSRGKMYYSYLPIQVSIRGTQEQDGGMTDIYRDNGTYRKSFYTVMALPSCSKISSMGITNQRIHHEISWQNCIPKILSGRYKKA